MNEAQGVQVRVAANRAIDPDAARALGAEPVLPANSWESSGPTPMALVRYARILRHNFRVYRSCSRLLKRWGTVDCIQAPVVRIHHLIAWLALTRQYGGHRFRRLVMQVNMPEGRHEKGRLEPIFKRSSILIQRVLRAYGPYVANGLVCLGSDSDQTAKDYETLSGVPFIEFPTPRLAPLQARRSAPRDSASPIVFCCLGPSRHEKGSDLLLAAIEAYLRLPKRIPARFVVQWTGDFTDSAGRTVLPSRWLLEHPDVMLIRRSLPSEEYDRYLLASDCIVLPYRWNAYYCRISGLAVEAATAGIPVIYTEDTWLDRAMKRYGTGLPVRDGDVAHLVEKLVEMAARIEEFQASACARAPLAREVNSRESFLKCLWGGIASA
jgi:glycosyltransferase involved in cell wall biosynthesis